MKVDKILPCVCCDHEPNSGDSVYYGMPQLKVCGGKPETFLRCIALFVVEVDFFNSNQHTSH